MGLAIVELMAIEGIWDEMEWMMNVLMKFVERSAGFEVEISFFEFF